MTEFYQWLIVFLVLVIVGGKELVFLIARKKGWINGNGNKEIKTLNENHIPHLEHKLDKIIEKMEENNVQHTRIIDYLTELKNK